MRHLKSLTPERLKAWILPAFCLLLIGAAIAATMFDISVTKLLLWAFVLACPLSHLLFGHGGHGALHDHASKDAPDEQPVPDSRARY